MLSAARRTRFKPCPENAGMCELFRRLLKRQALPVRLQIGDLAERPHRLPPDKPPRRVPEPDDDGRVEALRDSEVPPELLRLDPGVGGGRYPVVPCGKLHVLKCPPCVDFVEPACGVSQDYHREVGSSDPPARGAVSRELRNAFGSLDQYEAPVLAVDPGACQPGGLQYLQFHLVGDGLGAELADVKLSPYALEGVHG